jgi:hypothetical protein
MCTLTHHVRMHFQAFDAAGHPKDIAERIGLGELILGHLAGAVATVTPTTYELHQPQYARPPMETMLNLFDFEGTWLSRAAM